MEDRKIQGFDIEEPENAQHLYTLLTAVMKGERKITNVEHAQQQAGMPDTVYITSEKEAGCDEESIGICPKCGLPATHPSGLCRDCHQSKLEAAEV